MGSQLCRRRWSMKIERHRTWDREMTNSRRWSHETRETVEANLIMTQYRYDGNRGRLSRSGVVGSKCDQRIFNLDHLPRHPDRLVRCSYLRNTNESFENRKPDRQRSSIARLAMICPFIRWQACPRYLCACQGSPLFRYSASL
jgi:hypothetical protein